MANEAEREKFFGLLKGFNTVVLVTHRGERLDVRPMALAHVEPSCDLWFITGADTEKANEIQANPRVHVVAQHERDTFISLPGTARLLHDDAKIRELWNEPYRVWFPQGPEDPNIRLIHVEAESGEFWDNAGVNKAKYIFQAARAYVSGSTPKVDEGDQHGEMKL